MLNEKDRTLLSSILTATTGVAKTLVSIREEQKEQSKRLEKLEKEQETYCNELSNMKHGITRTLDDLTLIIKNNDETSKHNHLGLQDFIKNEVQQTSSTVIDELKDQFIRLITVLSEDERLDDLDKHITEFETLLVDKLDNHDKIVNNKLNNLNQIKVMKALIESLTTMQKDMSKLTVNMEANTNEFSNLADANRTMAARLDSVDLRMISMIDVKRSEDASDDDLDALNDVVKLLESQQ